MASYEIEVIEVSRGFVIVDDAEGLDDAIAVARDIYDSGSVAWIDDKDIYIRKAVS